MSGGELGRIDQAGFLLERCGPLMIPIGLCSVLGTAMVLERTLFLLWTRERPARIYVTVSGMIRAGRHREALDFRPASRVPLARTLGAGLTQFFKNRQRLEEILAVAGQEQLTRLERRLRAREVMATIAPLLGLLGTVTRMIQAFRQVSAVQGRSARRCWRAESGKRSPPPQSSWWRRGPRRADPDRHPGPSGAARRRSARDRATNRRPLRAKPAT